MQQNENKIHIITLNIPDPPDYGGIIDSYYRIKTLHSLGVKIHLHCFAYGRGPSARLGSYCESVHYYTRRKGLPALLTWKPYIISSRTSKELLRRLLQDTAPVFFDGLHTTSYLGHPGLRNRIKAVRLHNIEHRYYRTLSILEKNVFKKLYFFLEAKRLQHYERILSNADCCFTVSPDEQQYFQKRYKNAEYVPSFNPFIKVESLPGKGNFVLFHGDLSVSENITSCDWLIREVFSLTKYPCIIAGKRPPKHLKKLAEGYSNIRIVADPDNTQMDKLIHEAHIHVLIAQKNNGLKLKVLISLYAGRFCLVNPVIVENTDFEKLCHIAVKAPEFLAAIDSLMEAPFSKEMVEVRETCLNAHYNNRSNALKMMQAMLPGFVELK